MTPNLYDAWLTAGNNLQPIGDWLTVHWLHLAILAAGLAFATWALRRWIRGGLRDYRTLNDRVAADRITRFEDRPEPGTPGADDDLLDQCKQILRATENRKENKKP